MNPNDLGPDSLTRRDFGSILATAAVLSLAESASANEPKKTETLEESLLATIRTRYGKHLTAEQLESVRHSLKHGLARAQVMKRVALSNADEPAIVFRA